jgi:FKBP-type peptidyl-prolyl cis-trans isomerase
MGRRSRASRDEEEEYDNAMESRYAAKRQKASTDAPTDSSSNMRVMDEEEEIERKLKKAAKKQRQRDRKESTLKTAEALLAKATSMTADSGELNENSDKKKNKDKKKVKGKKEERPNGRTVNGVWEPDEHYRPPPKPEDAPKGPKVPELLQLSGGVKYYDKQVGKGPALIDRKTVHVSYVGRAKDKGGKVFDRNSDFSFRLGKGEVIKGFDVGVAGMRRGGTRCLYIPSNMGYKDKDVGAGRGATLYFEINVKL